jgi:hypothetical protein
MALLHTRLLTLAVTITMMLSVLSRPAGAARTNTDAWGVVTPEFIEFVRREVKNNPV